MKEKKKSRLTGHRSLVVRHYVRISFERISYHSSLNEITPYAASPTYHHYYCYYYHDYDYVFLERIIFVINLHWAILKTEGANEKNKEIIKNRHQTH